VQPWRDSNGQITNLSSQSGIRMGKFQNPRSTTNLRLKNPKSKISNPKSTYRLLTKKSSIKNQQS
jgi:hypothetical protein